MLKSLALCAAGLAACLLVACGGSIAENAGLALQPLGSKQARLKIFRTSDAAAAGAPARISIDGRQLGSLGVGDSTLLDVAAGPRRIVVDYWGHPDDYGITLVAKPGIVYSLEISPRAGAAAAGTVLGGLGLLTQASVNKNGGAFQIRVADAQPIRE